MNTKLTSQTKRQTNTKATLIKLAVDVHAASYTVVRQVDNSRMQPPQSFAPIDFLPWVKKQKPLAERVVVCYESGPFGFVLARQLQALGVECIVMAAQPLDERHKRVQTDRLDAQQIGSRLDRYLAGNSRALARVKIPTLEQELKRSESRQREQLLKTRKQLEAQGRALLVLNGWVEAPSHWWREGHWQLHQERGAWSPAVGQMLERWRAVLLQIQEQVESLTGKIEATLSEYLPPSMPQLPIGIGAWTWIALTRELLEWERFTNRRQVGSFSGLVASESTSGTHRHQGHITKVGNPRIRALAVELAWRLLQFQPDYYLVKKWRPKLYTVFGAKTSPSQRKRAIVALARQCMVDLWRLATGATTPQALGLKLPKAVAA